MTAGLPGVGIGGIFYLASALLMPARSLVAVLAGRPGDARWPLALRQASLAAGILGMIWLTGLALGALIALLAPVSTSGLIDGSGAGEMRTVVRTGALLLSLGTLALVLLVVQAVRLTLPRRPTPRNMPAEPDAPKLNAA